jgi:tetratricopeptide (TPR) repeat protein
MSDPNNEQNEPSPNAGENDLEDTKPRRIVSEPADEPNVAATTPISVSSIEPGAETFEPDFDHTRPTPVDEPEELAPRGFEHTIPPPAGFGMELEPPETGDRPLDPISDTAPRRLNASAADAADVAPAASDPGQPTPTTQRVRRKKVVRKKKSARRGIPGWILIPVLGAAAFISIAVLSAASGYFSGIGLRQDAQRTQMVGVVDQQFQLGLQDLTNGDYFRARQRFEYVISLNPSYPGATEKLAEALAYLNATATPTLAPTPTLTPTPDTRANEDLFNQSQQAVLNQDWDAAVDALLSLRGNDPNYRPIEIDGMLYLALRNRGKDKIVGADLESGIYDLNLAAKFAPLDSEAKGLMDWSQLYITGASFWEIDWAQVVQYFSQVAPSMPNLMDASRMTASERYRQGLYRYGNQLASEGRFCQAAEQYQQSLQIAQNPEVQTAWEQAVRGCEGGGGGGDGTPKPGGGNGGGGKKKTPTVEPPAGP